MFNSYTEEFKKNAVALVKTGYGVADLAKRLHVPPSSILNCVSSGLKVGLSRYQQRIFIVLY